MDTIANHNRRINELVLEVCIKKYCRFLSWTCIYIANKWIQLQTTIDRYTNVHIKCVPKNIVDFCLESVFILRINGYNCKPHSTDTRIWKLSVSIFLSTLVFKSVFIFRINGYNCKPQLTDTRMYTPSVHQKVLNSTGCDLNVAKLQFKNTIDQNLAMCAYIARTWANNYRALLRKMIYKDKAFCVQNLAMYAYFCTGWRRPIGGLVFIEHFPQKSPVIIGSFARLTCNLRHPMCLCHPVHHVSMADDWCLSWDNDTSISDDWRYYKHVSSVIYIYIYI